MEPIGACSKGLLLESDRPCIPCAYAWHVLAVVYVYVYVYVYVHMWVLRVGVLVGMFASTTAVLRCHRLSALSCGLC